MYLLDEKTINDGETKTLAELGFENNCQMTVRLKLKGGVWDYHYNHNINKYSLDMNKLKI